MRKIILASLVALLAALHGCESASPLLPENELIVVRAYLYAGEPVTDVQLTTTFALTSDDTTGRPINDAKASLEKAGKVYQLTASRGDSGYYHFILSWWKIWKRRQRRSIKLLFLADHEVSLEHFARAQRASPISASSVLI